MKIISWDVGVIHLAYCVLDHNIVDGKTKVNILAWDEINLIEDERVKLSCCGVQKGDKVCGKNARFYLKTPTETFGYCKTHLEQHKEKWRVSKTKKLFSECDNGCECTYKKKDGTLCGKSAKIGCKLNDDTFCTAHGKSALNNRIKEFSPALIKNLVVKKFPTAQLQLNLINKLDSLSKKFAKLGIEEVVIENQPSVKNPKMKSIANTLFDHFIIRGYIDHVNNLDIKLVRFMCPSNKLKVNNNNTIEVFKNNGDSKQKYKLTKALGIKYTKQLLNKNQNWLDHLESYKKKDDLCDAYLQGRYYLEFIKHKPAVNLNLVKEQENMSDSVEIHDANNVKSDKKMKKNNSKTNKKSVKKSAKKSVKKSIKKSNKTIDLSVESE